jgi:predicted pyridoxine 5'-phosphate oxidase superfamily flavin-nucleotide-binding protein
VSERFDEPFHEGERAVQERMGVRERLAEVGPLVMRAILTAEHRAFFPLLDFVVVGVVDASGYPRASIVEGDTGFAAAPAPALLSLAALPATADPARARLQAGAPIAVLGLQPHTRRRNRVNGKVKTRSEAGVVVDVEQAFGNCPKFIRARTTRRAQQGTSSPSSDHRASSSYSSSSSSADIALIRRADTFFIASAHPTHGVDVSHRGGRAGFVDVDAAGGGALWVPDFQGNFYFNTLGNLVSDPRAGLLFVDDDGGLLQIAVDVEIIWDGAVVDAFAGAQRVLRMSVSEVVRVERALSLRFVDGPASPFTASTGSW